MITGLIERNPVFSLAGAIYLVLFVLFFSALLIDSRTIDGFNVWVKPIKFSLSLLVYFVTLAWFSQWLADTVVASVWFWRFNLVMLFCSLVEIIWIAAAAAGANPSHFNTEHPVLAPLYPLMGVIAIALLSATLIYGCVAMLLPVKGEASGFWRQAIGLSLIITFVLTLLTASYLAAQPGHGVAADGESLVQTGLFGWLRQAGDLRVAHFFAMHAMQIVPLAVWLMVLLLPGSHGFMLTIAVAGGYCVFVAATFFQALAGKPFMPGLL